jgi:hypothetical protein
MLPAEIRNLIYYFFFRNMVLRILPPQGSLSVMTNTQDLALLSTCRQTYSEAAPLLYKYAEMRLLSLQCIGRFSRLLKPEYRPSIRSLTIWYSDWLRRNATDAVPIWSYLLPNLQQFVVRGDPKRRTSSNIHSHTIHGEFSLVFLAENLPSTRQWRPV